MNSRRILPAILLGSIMAVSVPARAQGTAASASPNSTQTRASADAAMFQKKIAQAQARIRNNQTDADLLKKATKLTDAALAKQILLRNGFTADDLADAKIILLTGGGKGGKDEIEISAICCSPKEITIQRTLDYFTK